MRYIILILASVAFGYYAKKNNLLDKFKNQINKQNDNNSTK